MPEETILSRIKSPADLKQLTYPEMTALCGEIRDFLIQTVSATGGHLSSNLGVVELTVALHKVFDTPLDRLSGTWGSVLSPQAAHRRMEQFHTLRQENGLGGFPRPSESEYDTFIAGHSSTSISAANGMAKAKTLAGEDGYVVAIIGDGALTGGLAYEGLSNAGRSKDKLVVVLNDNRMSISRNVGFVARYLANLRAKPRYVRFKNAFGNFLSHIPLLGKGLYNCLIRVKTKLKQAVYKNSSMFEQMGFHYLGPIDGHDLKDLTRAMETAKKSTVRSCCMWRQLRERAIPLQRRARIGITAWASSTWKPARRRNPHPLFPPPLESASAAWPRTILKFAPSPPL